MNNSSRLHSWKRMTTAVQCLEQCLVSKAFTKGLNNLYKSYCGGCKRKLFHVGVSRFPRLSLTRDVSLSSFHCSVLMAILSARWQRDDRPEYVSGRTRICNHRHRRRGGTRSTHNSITGEAPPVQLRPEGGEQLRLSGLASNAAQLHHGRTGYQHPRPLSHPGLDLDKKAVLGQLGHREYWFAERASEHVGSVEEWEDYVGGKALF